MASTLRMTFQIKGTVGTELVEFPSDTLYAPISISLTNDLRLVETCSLPSGAETEILTIGSGSDIASASIIVLVPSVACVFGWELTSAANNSTAGCGANVPFILSTGKANPYDAVPGTAIAGTPANIVQVSAYQGTGSAGTVRIFVGS